MSQLLRMIQLEVVIVARKLFTKIRRKKGRSRKKSKKLEPRSSISNRRNRIIKKRKTKSS